jgi:predicted ATPase
MNISECDYRPESVTAARERFIVISGCSGGGKSSLVEELAQRGYQTVAEPGRQVIREQNAIGGDATPKGNVGKFLDLTISRSMHQMTMFAMRDDPDIVFFDRSIIDQLGGFGVVIPDHLERAAQIFRYGRIFLVPPWEENFCNDVERTHSFKDALVHYEGSLKTYARFGYAPIFVPKLPIAERADFVLKSLGRA